jgi:hypothetical protein
MTRIATDKNEIMADADRPVRQIREKATDARKCHYGHFECLLGKNADPYSESQGIRISITIAVAKEQRVSRSHASRF